MLDQNMQESVVNSPGDLQAVERDVMLVFPPQWSPMQPYLSLPSLTAYLLQHGISVSQHDLNLDFYENFYSAEHLHRISAELVDFFRYLDSKSTLTSAEQTYYYSLFLVQDAIEDVNQGIKQARRFFTDRKRFFDICEYSRNRKLLNIASNLINIHYRFRLSLEDLDFGVDWESLTELERFFSAATPDSPIAFFEKQVSRLTERASPKIVGISINGPSQLIPGLTMARWLKRERPTIHVTLGGNLLSRCASALSKLPSFFERFSDSIILLEGEIPLLRLVEALSNRLTLDTVPNLLYLNKQVRRSYTTQPLAADDLPTPAFEGLPLDHYWSPYRILPILSSRGCYWNKCTFCDHSYIYGENYRQRSPSLVIDDLKSLQKNYGVKLFSFADEALSPNAARRISELLIRENMGLALFTQVRMEKTFSKDICQQMARAGFKMVFVGLESGSKATLRRIRKGIDLNTAPKILKRFHASGIFVHLFVLFGFPGETPEGIKATEKFVKANRENIFSMGASSFVLGKFSPVGLDAASYGVRVFKEQDKELSCHWEFEYLTGQTMEGAEKVRDRFNAKARDRLPYGPAYSEMDREHMFLYVWNYSRQELLAKCEDWRRFQRLIYNPGALLAPLSDDCIPKLRKGVFLRDTGFDALEIRNDLGEGERNIINRNPSFFVYNLRTQKTAKISRSGFATLLLCDGSWTVGDLVSTVAATVCEREEEVRTNLHEFLSDMSERGFVDLRF